MDSTENNVVLVDKFDRIQAGVILVNGVEFPVYKGVNTIGRNRDATVNLKNMSVSSQQALITIVDEKQHYISDMKSSNGTILSHTKLQPYKLYELIENAEIIFGSLLGVYKKIVPKDNAVLNNAPEQLDVTQSFYGAHTQIFANDTISNQTLGESKKSSNFHEETTQVLEENDGFKRPNVPVERKNDESVEEDIHEAATQVYEIESKTDSCSDIHEVETQVLNSEKETEDVIPPMDYECNDYDYWNTDNVTRQSLELDHQQDLDRLAERIRSVDNSLKDCDDSIAKYSESRRTTMGEVEESVYDESLSEVNASTKPQNEGDDSTESLDLLSEPPESQLHTSQLKRRVFNRIDSESPEDESQLQVQHMKRRAANRIESSESIGNDEDKTAIEDDEKNIQEAKKDEKKNIDSGSDTDIEEDRKSKKIDDDSDTDIDEEALKRNTETNKKSVGMDDSDFIPATQDVVNEEIICSVEVKQNSQGKSQGSTQESFKLGLTELMVGGLSEDKISPETKTSYTIHTSQEPSTSKQRNSAEVLANDSAVSELSMEELFLSNTEKTDTTDNNEEEQSEKKKFSFKKTPYNVIETNLSVLEREKQENDIYTMSTQQLKEDDVFLKPTQDMIMNKKHKNDEDDIYMAATQQLHTPSKKTGEKPGDEDDIYEMATQQLNTPIKTVPSEDKVTPTKEDDVFDVATQKLDSPVKIKEFKNTTPSKDADDFDVPTQILNASIEKPATEDLDTFDIPTQKLDTPEVNRVKVVDAFDIPTQKLGTPKVSSCKKSKIVEDVDILDVATQKLDTPVQNKVNDKAFEVPTQKLETPRVSRSKKSKIVDDEDILDVATQKLDTPVQNKVNDEAFEVPTQKLETPRVCRSKKSKIVEDVNILDVATQKLDTPVQNKINDEVFEVSTQILETPVQNKISDEAFEVPTQKLDTPVQSKISDEAFEAPTQKLETPKVYRGKKSKIVEDSDTFDAPTQKLNTRGRKSTIVKTEIVTPNKNLDDVFDIPTQKIVTPRKPKTELVTPKKTEIATAKPYYESTQCLLNDLMGSEEVETQMEADFPSQNVKLLSQNENRPKNPLCEVFKTENVDTQEEVVVKRSRSRNSSSSSENSVKRGNKRSAAENSSDRKKSRIEEIKGDSSEEKKTRRGRTVKKPLKLEESEDETSNNKDKRKSRRLRHEEPKIEDTILENSIKDPSKSRRRVHTDDDIKEGVAQNKTRKLQEIPENPETTTNKSLNSTEVAMSSVDQSFAILEAKALKTRKTRRTDVQVDVKVTVSKNRRSMTTGSLQEVAQLDEVKPRGRRTKVLNNNTIGNASSSSSSSTSPSASVTSRRGRKPSRKLLESQESIESLKMSPTNKSVSSTPERTKRKLKPKVVFTMLDNPELESYVRQLGGSMVDSVDSCTVLVTNSVKRSQKLLSAVGQGKPICSQEWIKASKKKGEFLDPWDYILKDPEAEKKWDFKLEESIRRAANNKLLNNHLVVLVVNIANEVLKGAVDACGGKCVTRVPAKTSGEKLIIVSTPENKSKYAAIAKKNPEALVVEPEAIFDGVLRQQLRLERHLLK